MAGVVSAKVNRLKNQDFQLVSLCRRCATNFVMRREQRRKEVNKWTF